MKTLHIIASVNPETGGPIEGILSLHRATSAVRTIEIVSLDCPDEPFVQDYPVALYALGTKSRDKFGWSRPVAHWGYTSKLIPWLKNHIDTYDAVVVNGLWNYAAFGASVVLTRIGRPYFVFPHGMINPWARRVNPAKHLAKQLSWFFSEGPLLEGARAVLFTAAEECALARGLFKGFSYRENVIGYGVMPPPPPNLEQLKAFHSAVPALGGKPYLLFLSRIHPKKGVDLLLDAFAKFVLGNPSDLQLVIAGPSCACIQSELEAQTRSLGISGHVHWSGMLLGDAKWGAYRSASAFILPSHHENFGIVIAEALACGIPVLTTNKVNIWRELEHCGCGLIGNDDVHSILALLENYFALSERRKQRMRQAAFECFNEHFHASLYASRMLELECEAASSLWNSTRQTKSAL
jgi:glycosyltransferase involved in cell wall biosynthesis